jgi:hypothetical protein
MAIWSLWDGDPEAALSFLETFSMIERNNRDPKGGNNNFRVGGWQTEKDMKLQSVARMLSDRAAFSLKSRGKVA